jgi:LacI family transcriptional regulator
MPTLSGSNVMSSTMKDVALLAGVSIATVSRVTNGAENVSGKTRTRVMTAISKLQYCPNVHAAELGRANGGIPRKRGIQPIASTRR